MKSEAKGNHNGINLLLRPESGMKLLYHPAVQPNSKVPGFRGFQLCFDVLGPSKKNDAVQEPEMKTQQPLVLGHSILQSRIHGKNVGSKYSSQN